MVVSTKEKQENTFVTVYMCASSSFVCSYCSDESNVCIVPSCN